MITASSSSIWLTCVKYASRCVRLTCTLHETIEKTVRAYIQADNAPGATAELTAQRRSTERMAERHTARDDPNIDRSTIARQAEQCKWLEEKTKPEEERGELFCLGLLVSLLEYVRSKPQHETANDKEKEGYNTGDTDFGWWLSSFLSCTYACRCTCRSSGESEA